MDTLGNSELTASAHDGGESAPDYVIGVLSTLSIENAAIKTLLSKVNTDAQSVNVRRHYLPKLSRALTAHIQTQRQVLLPALLTPEILEPLAANVMRLTPEMRAIATQPLRRWQAAQSVVGRKLELLKRTPPMNFAWRGNFDALAAAVEEYIDEEHQVVFPIAAKLLTPLKLLSLDIRYTRELGAALKNSTL